MLVQSYKSFLVTGILGLLSLAPTGMYGQAAPAAQTPQKNWKDRAEYDLYDAITKDTNAKTRLDKLEQWQKQYPQTDYKIERATLLVTTHAALGQAKETTDAAKQLLADDPKNFTALYYTMYFTQPLYGQSQTPEVLEQGEKASNTILSGIDTPPPNVTGEQWAKLRPDIELLAHVNLGFIAMQRKNWDAAEAEFGKSLQLNPNNGLVDFWMGLVIYSPRSPSGIHQRSSISNAPARMKGQAQPTRRYVNKAWSTQNGSTRTTTAAKMASMMSWLWPRVHPQPRLIWTPRSRAS